MSKTMKKVIDKFLDEGVGAALVGGEPTPGVASFTVFLKGMLQPIHGAVRRGEIDGTYVIGAAADLGGGAPGQPGKMAFSETTFTPDSVTAVAVLSPMPSEREPEKSGLLIS